MTVSLARVAAALDTAAPDARDRLYHLLDGLLHAQDVVLTSGQAEGVVRVLTHATGGAYGGAVAGAALRGLGCVVYVNGERCSRWHADAAAAALRWVAPPPPTAAPTPPTSSAGGDQPPSEALLHAALVCYGNVLARASARAPLVDAGAGSVAALARVLVAVSWAATRPAADAAAADAAGRVLSAGLRVLHLLLQLAAGGHEGLRGALAAGRTGDECVRLLHAAASFGVALERERAASAAAGVAATAGESASGSRISAHLVRRPAALRPPRGGASAAGSWRSVSSDGDSGSRGEEGGGDDGEGGAEDDDEDAALYEGGWPAGRGGADVGDDADDEDPEGYWWGEGASQASGTGIVAGTGDGGGAGGGGGGARCAQGAASTDAGSRRGPKPRRIPIRVRATALQCVAALAKAAPRVLHARWGVFLPEVQGTHPRPFAPSLLTLVLYDVSARVREAAAGALAAVVADAPLDKWIAVPATAVGGGSAGGSGFGGSGAVAAGGGGGGAASSLSDKASAMVRELHVGLQRALAQTDAARRPAMTVALLKAGAALVAASPYARLPLVAPALDALCDQVCELMLGRRAAPPAVGAEPRLPSAAHAPLAHMLRLQPQVAAAALHFCGAVCGSAALTPPSSMRGGADAGAPPPAPALVMRLLQRLAPIGAAAAAASDAASTALGGEVLAVFAKASRAVPELLVSAELWREVAPLLLRAFASPTPTVRVTALKLLEEVLGARARAATPGVGGGAADDAEEHGDAVEPARASGGGVAAGNPWEALEGGGGAVVGGATALTPVSLLRTYLPRACRDSAPAVRAGALACLSHALPADWAAAMGAPGPTATRLRIDLLGALHECGRDTAAAVREGAARVWGAYAALPAWRTPLFARPAAGALLHALCADDSGAVRARAAWALSQLCATAVAAPRGEDDSGAVARLLPLPGEDAASLPPPPPLNPLVRSLIDAHATDSGDADDSCSPSVLVALLSLPVVRTVLQVAGRAVASEGDRVASAALRAMGAGCAALLLHWLPRPQPSESAAEAAVLSGANSGGGGGGGGSFRACPDDALVLGGLLVLAEVVAREPAAAGPGAQAKHASVQPDASSATARWQDVADDVDVRALIAARAQRGGGGGSQAVGSVGEAGTRPADAGPAAPAPAPAPPRAGLEPPSAPAGTNGRGPAASAAAVKLRWSACGALCMVLPLADRVAGSHAATEAAATEDDGRSAPRVALSNAWVPPVLAALQGVLAEGASSRVRIAAARALALVPSRRSLRVQAAGSASPPGGAPASPAPPAPTALLVVAAATSYRAQQLQAPGYDALLPAIVCLLAALRRCGDAGDFHEYRYRGALAAAVRCALLRILGLAGADDVPALAAQLRYDAPFLLCWLAREQALCVGGGVAPTAALAGAWHEETATAALARLELAATPDVTHALIQRALQVVTSAFVPAPAFTAPARGLPEQPVAPAAS